MGSTQGSSRGSPSGGADHGSVARLPQSSRGPVRLALAAAALLLLWFGVSELLVPALVRALHGGGAPGLADALMPGRDQVGPGAYLTAWDGLARHVTAVAVPLSVVAVVASWSVRPCPGRTDPGSRQADGAGSRPGAGELLLVSLWAGLVTGVGEGYYLGAKAFYLRELVPDFFSLSPDALWMAPAADATTFVLLGALVGLSARAVGRGVSLPWLAGLLVFAGAAALLMRSALLHPAAVVLLAAGIAHRVGRWVADGPARFRRLVRTTTPALAGLVLLAAFAVQVPWGRDRVPEEADGPGAGAPNVLLLILDTVRADHLSPYGYERDTSPFLDELARRGVVFEHAFATAPFTLPSHATALTGRFGYEHGLTVESRMDPRFPTLAGALARAGYSTGGFVANVLFCNDWYGFGRGFHVYDDRSITLRRFLRSAWITRRISEPLRPLFGLRGHHMKRPAPEINARFLGWLDEGAGDGGAPFFAMLNYMDAHAPFRPPESHRRRFSSPEDRYWWPDVVVDPSDRPSPAELEEIEATYDETIAYLDGELRRLFRELRRRGLLENTLVVVTSDHGEQFGEHGLGAHANSLYRQVLHVPLIVVPPGGARPPRRVSTPVSLRDLPATILDVVGRPVPPGLPGRSLAPAWSSRAGGGDPAGALAEVPVVSEHDANRSVVLGRWHLIVRRSGETELYDLRTDPAESRDLSDTPEGRRRTRDLYRVLAPYRPPELPDGASSARR